MFKKLSIEKIVIISSPNIDAIFSISDCQQSIYYCDKIVRYLSSPSSSAAEAAADISRLFIVRSSASGTQKHDAIPTASR